LAWSWVQKTSMQWERVDNLFFFYVKIRQGTTYVCMLFSLHTGVGQAHVYSANGHCAAFLANIDNRRKVTVHFRGQSYLLPPWSVSILPDCKKVIFNTAQVTQLSFPVLQLLNSSWYQEEKRKRWLIYLCSSLMLLTEKHKFDLKVHQCLSDWGTFCCKLIWWTISVQWEWLFFVVKLLHITSQQRTMEL
jgi:hypothetical protein